MFNYFWFELIFINKINIMKRFIVKKILTKNLQKRHSNTNLANKSVVKCEDCNENKDVKKDNEVMDTKEKIKLASEILENQPKVKKIKKEKGLIERTESSKTVLTEDNRELLRG